MFRGLRNPLIMRGGQHLRRKFSTEAGAKVTDSRPELVRRFIRDKIKSSGPITVAEYMKVCLSAPESGYYTGKSKQREIFGDQGDFVTSPEVSQMFGEVLGAWVLHEMRCMGMGEGRVPWQLVELGPGRGLMLSDILRVLQKFKATSAMSIRLVEVSEKLAEEQEKNIRLQSGSGTEEGRPESHDWYKRAMSFCVTPAYWYKNILDVPKRFSVILAHEFFDALPIHSFRRSPTGEWREICVDLVDSELRLIISPTETPATRLFLPAKVRNNPSMSEFEACPEAAQVMADISNRVVQNGGLALIIDYGHEGEKGRTLRAFKGHEIVDPLTSPGEVDLTADVNFSALKSAAGDDVICFGPVSQRDFLLQLGIELRLQALLKAAKTDREKEYLEKSFHMLTDADTMGEKFKVMAVFPRTMSPIFDIREAPSGFHAQSQEK